MMAREQPSPRLAAHRLAEDRNPIVCRSHALDGVASGPRAWRIMLQVFELRRPQNVVVAHDRCDLVVALAAGGRAQEIVQPEPAVHAERADIHSNPRNKRDRQIAPRRPLVGFERKGDGLARSFVERGEKGGGGVAHAPCRICVRGGRRLAGALRNRFAQLLGQQNRGGNAQSEMSSVHGAFSLFLNDPRALTLASLTLASSNDIALRLNPRNKCSATIFRLPDVTTISSAGASNDNRLSAVPG